MNINPIILVKTIEVRNSLDEIFGFTRDLLMEIVEAAVNGRNSCTANDPCSAPGWMSWREGTRRMREILLPLGWERDETDNIPSVIHRERNIKIAVCNSDEGTGLKDYHPQPVTKKGDGTQRAISSGQSVFEEVLDSALNFRQPRIGSFWYLCIYHKSDDFRAELSCPILNEDGSFKDFLKRIILIGQDGYDGGTKIRNQEPDDTVPEFEIPVTRKRAV